MVVRLRIDRLWVDDLARCQSRQDGLNRDQTNVIEQVQRSAVAGMDSLLNPAQ
jgi:hypothetical protein